MVHIISTPFVLCHRGWHHHALKNTMAAFERAARLQGVHGIETDVRPSADGLLVLHHDATTPDGAPVHSLTRAGLEALVGHPVATLNDVLGHWPYLIWNLEIKTQEAVAPTLSTLKAFSHPERILITSFVRTAIEACAATGKFACGLLWAHKPENNRLHDSVDNQTYATVFGVKSHGVLECVQVKTIRLFSPFLADVFIRRKTSEGSGVQ